MKEVDFLFKEALVIDGSGQAGKIVDLATSEDQIFLIQPRINLPAKRVIQAKRLVLAPGFIDIHGHTDHFLCVDPESSSKISQGVTTEVFGNCGYSSFLLKGKFKKHFQKELTQYGLDGNWNDLESFSEQVAQAKPAINWLTLVGHGTLRLALMGHDHRPPTAEELKRMKRELKTAMEQGAFGLSTGLIYPPGCFAKTPELIELAKVAGESGGFYATHMRSEGDKLLEAIREAIRISDASKTPLQISHLKTAGEKNWNKIDDVFELLEEALGKGLDVAWDRYPYTASFTSLDTCLPRNLFDGGDLRAVEKLKNPRTRERFVRLLDHNGSRLGLTLIASLPGKKNRRWLGRTLKECSHMSQKSIGEFVIDLLIEEAMQVGAIFFSMSEDNLDRILLHSKTMIGSDASARSHGGKTFLRSVHPRTYGTFPRFLKQYALDSKKIPLEEAIYKMTGLAAKRLGLKKRGLLQSGYSADLVLFNPGKLKDRATYQKPALDSQGIEMVLVNGQIALERGEQTAHRAGTFIRNGER